MESEALFSNIQIFTKRACTEEIFFVRLVPAWDLFALTSMTWPIWTKFPESDSSVVVTHLPKRTVIEGSNKFMFSLSYDSCSGYQTQNTLQQIAIK